MNEEGSMTFKEFAVVFAIGFAVTLGCGDMDGPSPPEDEPLAAGLQARFNSYAQALLERDVSTLDRVLSTEIKARAAEMGSDLGGLADKLKASMLKQFGTMPPASMSGEQFTVASATVEAEAVRVMVAFQGRPLEKPFFFVREDGDYKLNVLRAGFSKPLPAGSAAARDTYLVTNQNGGPYGQTMYCNGGSVHVLGDSSGTVSCNNNCGWWHGSGFSSGAYDAWLNCDYNTWGTDVWINLVYVGGWDCNDYC
jgi:hypothetical protein